MARIAGVDLPRDKRVEIGLTYIFGIGRKTATDIIAATGVNPDTRVRDLTEEDVSKLREYIEHNCRVEGDLRRDIAYDIKRLIDIGCYRGVRHRKGLPVRGQRSKTNARTRKGPRKTMGKEVRLWQHQRVRRLSAVVVSVSTSKKAQRISSLHSTTQSLRFPIHRATLFHGQAQASSASEVPRSPLRSRLSPLQRPLQERLWSTV